MLDVGKRIKDNQTDIRSATDPFSALSMTQTGDKRIKIPDSYVVHPLRSHGTYNLKKFERSERF